MSGTEPRLVEKTQIQDLQLSELGSSQWELAGFGAGLPKFPMLNEAGFGAGVVAGVEFVTGQLVGFVLSVSVSSVHSADRTYLLMNGCALRVVLVWFSMHKHTSHHTTSVNRLDGAEG